MKNINKAVKNRLEVRLAEVKINLDKWKGEYHRSFEYFDGTMNDLVRSHKDKYDIYKEMYDTLLEMKELNELDVTRNGQAEDVK